MISEDLANRLHLKGKVDPLLTQWTNGSRYRDDSSRRVNLGIQGSKEDQKYLLQDVRTVKVLDLPQQTVKLKKNWKHLDGLDVEELENAKPQILIGQDHCHLIEGRKVIEGPPNAPILTYTKLGWTLHGCHSPAKGRTDDFICCSFRPAEDEDLHSLVKQSFTVENFGVAVNDTRPKSREDERAWKILETTTKRTGDRFESGLLWKREDVKLPESYTNALKRLINIEVRMEKDPELAKDYKAKLQDYLAKGYIRKLTDQEAKVRTDKTFYIPHFPVWNPNKPGKLRLVFDCAAKAQGASLNDHLVSGPDLLNSLPAILMKFRQR